jgi:hypothetical protein
MTTSFNLLKNWLINNKYGIAFFAEILSLMVVCLILVSLLSCANYSHTTSDKDSGPWPKDYLMQSRKIRQTQQNAGSKLLEEFYAAIKRGDKSFTIEPGTYRLSGSFKFTSLNNFVLDGQGSTFIFIEDSTGKVPRLNDCYNVTINGMLMDHTTCAAFEMNDCRNITIRNLTIDWDPVRFTQGKILEVDRENRTVLFKPDNGYEVTYKDLKYNKGTWRLFVFDDKGDFADYQVRNAAVSVDPGGYPFEKTDENGCYRFGLTSPNKKFYSPDQQGVSVGATVAICCRQGSNLFYMGDCGPVRIENIISYCTPYRMALGDGGEGPITFRNVQNIRRPGTNRLLSTGSDAFIITAMRNGPILENCKMEGICDDFISVSSFLIPVYIQTSPVELIVKDFHLNGDLHPVLHCLEYGSCKFIADLKVKSVSGPEDFIVPEGWGSNWTIPLFWKRGKGLNPGDTVRILRVELDKPFNLPQKGMFFSSESAVSAGTVIRNCTFERGMARGLNINTTDALIEGNFIRNCIESAILMSCEVVYWGGGRTAKNIVIRNNTFMGTNGRAISFPYSGTIQIGSENDLETAEWISNITIENNKFIRPGGSGIAINGARNVKIFANKFEECGNLPWHGSGRQPDQYGIPVAIYRGELIEQKNNIKINSGLYSLEQ